MRLPSLRSETTLSEPKSSSWDLTCIFWTQCHHKRVSIGMMITRIFLEIKCQVSQPFRRLPLPARRDYSQWSKGQYHLTLNSRLRRKNHSTRCVLATSLSPLFWSNFATHKKCFIQHFDFTDLLTKPIKKKQMRLRNNVDTYNRGFPFFFLLSAKEVWSLSLTGMARKVSLSLIYAILR